MDWGKQFGILAQIMRTVAIFAQKRLHKLPLAVIITFCKRLSIRFTEGERKLTHSKKEMRKAYLARLQQLDQNTRLREQHRLAQKLYDLPQWTNAKTVALTMSQSFELDTAPLILHARHEGKRVLVPRTLPKRQMEFVQIDEDTEFEETGFGVLEPLAGMVLQPQEIDLIVVPGVAFTADGKRLGFGGGYYDRYLANYPGRTVSLALTTQLADAAEWPGEDHDVRIGQVVNLEQE